MRQEVEEEYIQNHLNVIVMICVVVEVVAPLSFYQEVGIIGVEFLYGQ